jgi:DUF917 family protein
MCLEVGGINGLAPVMWAAHAGAALLDADARGRPLAGVHQQSMHLAGIPAPPVAVTDGRGNVLVVHARDDASAERLVRGAVGGMGGVCAAAVASMPAAAAGGAVVPGSLSAAVALGEVLHAAPRDAAAAAAETLGGQVLLAGLVTHLERQAGVLSTSRSATVENGRRQVRVELQAEYLLVLEDGEVRAAVPDVICLMDTGSGAPVPAQGLAPGRHVAVVAAPAPELWRAPRARALAGPRSFGYAV